MQIDRIEKRYMMNVLGPVQHQTRHFETAVFANVPPEAQESTDEGKKKFLELSDKLQGVARAIVERDALPAINEAKGKS